MLKDTFQEKTPMAVCVKCKAPLDEGARFCDACGEEQPQVLYCEECGAKLEPGAGFCDSCGSPVGGAVQSKPVTSKPSTSVLSSSGGAAYGLRLINKPKPASVTPAEVTTNKDVQALRHFTAGENHYGNADYQAAATEYSKAIELVSNNFNYYKNRAMAWVKLEKYHDAIADLDETIKINPGYHYIYNLKGVCCRAIKDYKAAVKAYEQALKLEPTNTKYKDALEKAKTLAKK